MDQSHRKQTHRWREQVLKWLIGAAIVLLITFISYLIFAEGHPYICAARA
jgi:hypothetical protein